MSVVLNNEVSIYSGPRTNQASFVFRDMEFEVVGFSDGSVEISLAEGSGAIPPAFRMESATRSSIVLRLWPRGR